MKHAQHALNSVQTMLQILFTVNFISTLYYPIASIEFFLFMFQIQQFQPKNRLSKLPYLLTVSVLLCILKSKTAWGLLTHGHDSMFFNIFFRSLVNLLRNGDTIWDQIRFSIKSEINERFTLGKTKKKTLTNILISLLLPCSDKCVRADVHVCGFCICGSAYIGTRLHWRHRLQKPAVLCKHIPFLSLSLSYSLTTYQ